MTLLSYLLNEQTPIDALLEYCVAAQAIADANAAALLAALPALPAELAALSDGCAALAGADAEWKDARRARGEARARRDSAHDAALALYTLSRSRLKLLRRRLKSDELKALLKGCPTPSTLRPADLVAALDFLSRGVATHAARFVRAGVTDATRAELDAKRLALAQAITTFVAADYTLRAASARRKEARLAALDQILLVEASLFSALPADAQASLEGARMRCLRRASRPADEAEDGEGDGEDPDDEDPAPDAG